MFILQFVSVAYDSCLFYFVTNHTASGVDRTKHGQLDAVCAKALPSPCRVIAREEQGEQTVPPSAGLKPGITVEHGGYTPPHKAAGTKQTDVGGWVQRTQHHSSETVVVLAAGRTLGRRQQRTRRGSETEEEVAGAAATLADELVFS